MSFYSLMYWIVFSFMDLLSFENGFESIANIIRHTETIFLLIGNRYAAIYGLTFVLMHVFGFIYFALVVFCI